MALVHGVQTVSHQCVVSKEQLPGQKALLPVGTQPVDAVCGRLNGLAKSPLERNESCIVYNTASGDMGLDQSAARPVAA